MFTERGTMVMADMDKLEAKKETYDFIKEQIVHKQIKVPVFDIKEMTVWILGMGRRHEERKGVVCRIHSGQDKTGNDTGKAYRHDYRHKIFG